MSTEYRRGIPSTAHVEAATRLGLEWEEVRPRRSPRRWRFQTRDGELWCDFWSDASGWDRDLQPLSSGRIADRTDVEHYTFRPMRTDGTPVDWGVLDQEVARVGQQGQPATVTPTTSATQPLSQPEGFRADLFRRIASHFDLVIRDVVGDFVARIISVRGLVDVNAVGIHANDYQWGWGTASTPVPGPVRTDILARWTVYQELKPLYDLVDGAQGEAAMPRDVEAEWFTAATMPVPASGHWFLCCDARGIHTRNHRYVTWRPEEVGYGVPLRNFAAVLDAVAERRAAERMRGQTQEPTITSAQPAPVLDEIALRSLILGLPNVAAITNRIERGSRQRDRYIVRVRLADPNVPLDRALAAQIPRNVHVHCNGHGAGGQRGVGGTAAVVFSPTGNREDAVAPPIQESHSVNVEPRRFADVRPDRHGWRWWRIVRDAHYPHLDQTRVEFSHGDFRWMRRDQPFETVVIQWWADRTVVPTDEQGNPVSWEAAGFAVEAVRGAQETVQRAADDATPARSVGDIEWTITGLPVTRHMTVDPATGVVRSTLPLPLPRFTADELDDVDHSKTTKLDEVTLRRGKLPTVEQIAKYREVRARRTSGTVADALKESRIDCEVAQYVLERWAGGLDNTAAHKLITWVVETTDVGLGLFVCSTEARAQQWIDHHSPTLDTSEKPNPTVQRERQEAEEQRQRLAELRQRLAAERTAQPQEMAKESEVSRFDLIEPDPQADPTASIRAWEARQAAAKVCPMAAPPRIAKPAAAPRRPAIEVVDAEVDGLSRSEAFAALFGRALNGGC